MMKQNMFSNKNSYKKLGRKKKVQKGPKREHEKAQKEIFRGLSTICSDGM